MKKKLAILFLALALVMPFQALAVAQPHTHQWGKAVVTKKRSCTEDGIRTRTCAICGETKDEVYKAYGHHFSDWSTDKQDKPGMLHRTCPYCKKVEYRYCRPLDAQEYPVAQVLADATRDVTGKMTIDGEDVLLTAEEIEKLDTLSAHDRMLVFLSVIGYDGQVALLDASVDAMSDEAKAVLEVIRARIQGMTAVEAEAFAAAVEAIFPQTIVYLDPTSADYQQSYITLSFEGETQKTVEYGFARYSSQWSFCQLQQK